MIETIRYGETLEVTYRVSDNINELDSLMDINVSQDPYNGSRTISEIKNNFRDVDTFYWEPQEEDIGGTYDIKIGDTTLYVKVISNIPDNNVEHRWSIDEGESNYSKDLFGSSNLSYNGANLINISEYYNNYALDLNGVDDRPTAPNKSTMSGFNTGMTYLTTININNLQNGSRIGQVNDYNTNDRSWRVGISNSELFVGLSDNGINNESYYYDFELQQDTFLSNRI
jgi:hypothetical protein